MEGVAHVDAFLHNAGYSMKITLSFGMILLFFAGCNSGPDQRPVSAVAPMAAAVPYPPGHHLTDCFLDTDTTIVICRKRLPDSSVSDKRKLVNMVLRAINGDEKHLDTLYDLEDFTVDDMDGDGAVDLVYSPGTKNFQRNEFNFSLLCRNLKDSFKILTLQGLVIDIDKVIAGKRTITTVKGPCCDVHNYILYEIEFYPDTWTCISKPVIEVHKSKIDYQ